MVFLPGFSWCVSPQSLPVLVWQTSPHEGYAFVQKGDGEVEVRFGVITLLQKGKQVALANTILVPGVMLAWAKTVLGLQHSMTLAHVSGMVASGVSPDDYDFDSDAPPAPSSPAPSDRRKFVLGRGEWTLD